jgi:hypothetical protein
MTAPTIPKRVGHPGTVPWESLPSLRAGLPRDRAGWLALVLPAIDAGRSHPEVARALSQLECVKATGSTVTASSVMLWHRKLSSMQEAGTLPEHPRPLPERRAGWREGMPLPSASQAAEGGRRAAVTRWGGKKGKGARKGPGKSGKGKP